MSTETLGERIVLALRDAAEPGRWMRQGDLLGLFDRTWDEEWEGSVRELIRDGVLGRTFLWEDLGAGCIGREWYVWLKTPETAERDREFEQLDLDWALYLRRLTHGDVDGSYADAPIEPWLTMFR
jgi:hypothetical protein